MGFVVVGSFCLFVFVLSEFWRLFRVPIQIKIMERIRRIFVTGR